MIKEAWEQYHKNVTPGVDPKSVQYVETQKAFYAGATVMLHAMGKLCATSKDLKVRLLALREEVDAFCAKQVTMWNERN